MGEQQRLTVSVCRFTFQVAFLLIPLLDSLVCDQDNNLCCLAANVVSAIPEHQLLMGGFLKV